jgi:hypothetical protein
MANTNITSATEKMASNYVPFGGQDIVLGEEATMPIAEFPLLQYATGLSGRRPIKDADGHDLYEDGEPLMADMRFKGFFTEVGRHPDLDAILREKDAKIIKITHGSGEEVTHWALPSVTVFLIAKGLPSNARGDGQCGMVYTWRSKHNGSGNESVVYAQVMIRQLLPEYAKPFVVTMKSTQSTDLLNAMSKQYKVLRKAHEVLQRLGKDMPLPLWSYSIALGAAKNTDARGAGKKSNIYPVISGVPEDITGEYLHDHEVPTEFIDILREAADKSVEWATGLHQRIVSNVEPQEPWAQGNSTAPVDEHPF